MADMISLRMIKQLLQMRGFTARISSGRVLVYTDELGWIDVATFMLRSIFGLGNDGDGR